MARRAVRPDLAGPGARPSTARATCSTARPSTRSSSDADVLVHLAFIILGGRDETRDDQPRGLAQRLRGRRRGRRQAARLHVVGRRLRLPRRQPAAADRGRPAARQRALLLLARRRPSSSRCCDEEIAGTDARGLRAAGPASSPGPDAPMLHAPASRRRLPARRSSTLLPDPGHAVPARPPRRRRDRAGRRRRCGAGPPGAYNLAGEGTITLGDLARALGWPLRSRSRASAARAPPRSAPACRSSRRCAQWVNAGRVPVVMDTGEGAPRAGLAAALRLARDAARARLSRVGRAPRRRPTRRRSGGARRARRCRRPGRSAARRGR